MIDARSAFRRRLPAAVPLAVGLVLVAARALPAVPNGRGPVRMDGWGVAELADHLRERGLGLRTLSEPAAGPNGRSALLTVNGGDWKSLCPSHKIAERVAEWKGTVHVEMQGAGWLDARTNAWGDCCLAAGPFLFFGDRDLLARIEEALRE